MSGDLMMGVDWPASPAAGRCMSGEPFVLDGRVGKVKERFPSHVGLQADALIIRFDESAPGQIGLLGTTVKSLEQRIAQGKVHFLENAAALNARQGWMSDAENIRREWRRGDYANPGTGMFANPPKRSALSQHIKPKIDGSCPANASLTDIGRAIRPYQGTRSAERHSAALSLIGSGSWMSVRQTCRCLWAKWRPEWGKRPSYSTVRRWVAASRTPVLARPRVRDFDERRAYK